MSRVPYDSGSEQGHIADTGAHIKHAHSAVQWCVLEEVCAESGNYSSLTHQAIMFCRVHKTLRVTPAMEAGLADHVWTLEELCGLLPERKPNARAEKEMILKALDRLA